MVFEMYESNVSAVFVENCADFYRAEKVCFSRREIIWFLWCH